MSITSDDMAIWKELKGDIQVDYLAELCGGSPENWAFARTWITKKCTDKKKYYYMLTFTLKEDCKDDWKDAEEMVSGQVERDALKIIEWHQVKELTKQGIAHWHCAVITTKALARNRFQHYEKIYGHVDINKNKKGTITEALNYMSKIGTPKKLI